jgi:hypothetical protein
LKFRHPPLRAGVRFLSMNLPIPNLLEPRRGGIENLTLLSRGEFLRLDPEDLRPDIRLHHGASRLSCHPKTHQDVAPSVPLDQPVDDACCQLKLKCRSRKVLVLCCFFDFKSRFILHSHSACPFEIGTLTLPIHSWWLYETSEKDPVHYQCNVADSATVRSSGISSGIFGI